MSLSVGEKAPAFAGKDQNGKPISLSDYSGKKVALYFYPKDNTPTCTEQACNLRDNYLELKSKGYEIIGVSTDDEKSHQKFIKKFALPFLLIADTDRSINEAFGVWVEKSMYGKTYMGTKRTTFIIDEGGIISQIIDKVVAKEHSAQIIG